jgi:hypothetical protein
MNQEEQIEFYNEYDNQLKRFCSKYDLFSFDFSLETLEFCSLMFQGELDLIDYEKLTRSYFDLHYYFMKKLSIQLKIKHDYNIIFDLFLLYLHVLKIVNFLSDSCRLHSASSFIIGECMSDIQIRKLQREGKYRTQEMTKTLSRGQKFNHYFYEFYSFNIDVTNNLRYYDSIRKELLSQGDTIHLINKRDIVLTLFKFYSYLSKGLSLERPNRRNQKT